MWLIKLHSDPFTLNTHYMSDYKEKFLTYYRRVRQDSRRKDANLGAIPDRPPTQFVFGAQEQEDLTGQALSILAKIGYEGLKREDLGKLLGQDVMEPALDIMATVRAYFQVAYKRFMDNIPMAIDYELVRGGERDIFQLIWTKLEMDGPNAHAMCDEYAQEAVQVAARRQELSKKLERLTEASRRLTVTV
ncbi:hypothetical protein AN958_00229 [Leucoagaricus sp. SymC.cos]|nr:hypothetical protein AN958_00229 [Leucoagaricus sp. SymC.cos]